MSEVKRDEMGRIVSGSGPLNPTGRPKKRIDLYKMLDDQLARHATTGKPTDDMLKTKGYQVIKKVIEQALDGDDKSQRLIWERQMGAVSQTIEHSGDGMVLRVEYVERDPPPIKDD